MSKSLLFKESQFKNTCSKNLQSLNLLCRILMFRNSLPKNLLPKGLLCRSLLARILSFKLSSKDLLSRRLSLKILLFWQQVFQNSLYWALIRLPDSPGTFCWLVGLDPPSPFPKVSHWCGPMGGRLFVRAYLTSGLTKGAIPPRADTHGASCSTRKRTQEILSTPPWWFPEPEVA